MDLENGKELGSVELPSNVIPWMSVSADGRYGVATKGVLSRTIDELPRVYVFRLPDPPAPK